MLASVFHLVESANTQKYQEIVQEIRNNRPDLSIRLSGPWPPYSFANIELEFKITVRSKLMELSPENPLTAEPETETSPVEEFVEQLRCVTDTCHRESISTRRASNRVWRSWYLL